MKGTLYIPVVFVVDIVVIDVVLIVVVLPVLKPFRKKGNTVRLELDTMSSLKTIFLTNANIEGSSILV